MPFLLDRLDAPGVDRVAGTAPPQSLAGAVHPALVIFTTEGHPGWNADVDGDGASRVFDDPVRDETGAFAAVRTLHTSAIEASSLELAPLKRMLATLGTSSTAAHVSRDEPWSRIRPGPRTRIRGRSTRTQVDVGPFPLH